MNFLDYFIPTETLSDNNQQKFGNYHIFIEMLTQFEKELSSAEYMELYYFFTQCEKCLTFSRRNEINSANTIFRSLAAVDRQAFSPNVINAVEANYYSCLAYFEYVEKRYDDAVAHMEDALKFTMIQKDLMAKFLPSIYELNVNILRVHVKTKDTQKIIDIFSNLLASVIYDVNNDAYLNAALSELSYEEKEKWAHHILNNSIHALWRKFGDESIEANAIYLAVFQNLFAHSDSATTPLGELADIIALNLQCLAGEEKVFDELSANTFDAIKNSPFYVKRMTLSNYLSEVIKNEDNIEDHENFAHFTAILSEHGLTYNSKPVYS